MSGLMCLLSFLFFFLVVFKCGLSLALACFSSDSHVVVNYGIKQ